ncbi:hypothetical protein HYZ82_00860 [Candidatus Nomurabacteria bacterium]|nr:hypothetical protein [Candidatus Nomurabacteria bacterium]
MRERGTFLTCMIGLSLIINLYSLYQATHTSTTINIYSHMPVWFSVYSFLASLLGVVTNIGLWLWKKWAVFVLLVSITLALGLHIFVLDLGKIQETAFFATILSGCLWYWAISRKWSFFLK